MEVTSANQELVGERCTIVPIYLSPMPFILRPVAITDHSVTRSCYHKGCIACNYWEVAIAPAVGLVYLAMMADS